MEQESKDQIIARKNIEIIKTQDRLIHHLQTENNLVSRIEATTKTLQNITNNLGINNFVTKMEATAKQMEIFNKNFLKK